MEVSFLTPLAAAVGLLVALAIWARVVARRRAANAASALGLPPAGRRGLVIDLVLLGLVGVLIGVAAAQPVVSRSEATHGRDGAEVLVVFDVTRSMLARRAPSEPTRLDRSRELAKRLRASIPETRVGVASLTDRVLPHLFPTLGSNSFVVGRQPRDRRRAAASRPPREQGDGVLRARRHRPNGVLPPRDRAPGHRRRLGRRDAAGRPRGASRAARRGARVDDLRPGVARGRGGLRRERRA